MTPALAALAIRFLTVAVGVALVYTAAFTYETTDKRIQNRLEDLWLALASEAGSPLSRAGQLARATLVLMDRLFERLVGSRLLSLRSVCVALCLAYVASVLNYVPISLMVGLGRLDVDVELHPAVLGVTTFVLASAVLPAMLASLRWVTYAVATAVVVSILAGLLFASLGRTEFFPQIDSPVNTYLVLLASVAYSVLVIHAIRYGIQAQVRHDPRPAARVVTAAIVVVPAALFLVMILLAFVIGQPTEVSRGLLRPVLQIVTQDTAMSLLYEWAGPIVSVWGLAAVVGVALAALVLLHLAMWPLIRFVLMKVLYAAQRHELVRRKRSLWSIGLGLIIVATAPLDTILAKIIGVVR